MPASTVGSKISLPPRALGLVDRTRLLNILNEKYKTHRVIILSAPAGYGKTTLIAQWLSTLSVPRAWLTIDALDNNLENFVTLVASSIHSAYPISLEYTDTLLSAPQSIPPSVLADAFIEDLATLPGPLILAIDDYHLITDEASQLFMNRLVQFMPTNIWLVITTRTLPQIPLSRLRASGQLAEVQLTDLQFTPQEAMELLTNLTGETVDIELATMLDGRLEGWAIGFRFVALSKQRGESIEEVAHRYSRLAPSLAKDYLIDQVLEQQPYDVQDFLLRTSILEQLTEELCVAVLGINFDTPFLERIWRSNLLITPVDEQDVWFRYHPLFREMLQRRLVETKQTGMIRELHQRAAAWLSDHGRIGDAISHWIAAENSGEAAKSIVNSMHRVFNQERWWEVLRWLELLPEDCRNSPALLVARGWVLVFQFRIHALKSLLEETEPLLSNAKETIGADDYETLSAQISVQKSMVAFWSGDGQQSSFLTENGLPYLKPDMIYARSLGQLYNALGHHLMGNSEKAIGMLQELMAKQIEPLPTITSRLLIGQALVHLEVGNLEAVKEALEMLGQIGHQFNLPASSGWHHYALGLIAYEQNELGLAINHLRVVIQSPFGVNGRSAYESFILLVFALEAQQENAAADEILQRLRDFLLSANYFGVLPLVDVLKRRIALLRGDTSSTTLSYQPPTFAEAMADINISFSFSVLLNQVRLWLTEKSVEALNAATATLETMLQACKQLHNQRRMIEILTLQALVHSAQGNKADALDVLATSLRLGESARFIRSYLDCGRDLIPLLEDLVLLDDAPPYANHILEASKVNQSIIDPEEGSQKIDQDALMKLRATLTNREFDVLNLLDQRLSNQEIADELYIEPETVKKHLQNLYRKLGVNNRRMAISFARRIGLIA